MDQKNAIYEFFEENVVSYIKCFISSFSDSLLLIIITALVCILTNKINTYSLAGSCILYIIVRENIFLLRYQKKKKDNKTILVVLKTDSNSIFKMIKGELEEKVNKLLENQTESLNVKFIEDYVYSQRVSKIKNPKTVKRIYGYPIYTVLTVNETTKRGKKVWSLTPSVYISDERIKENKEVQVNSEEFFANIRSIEADNSFYGIQDLSISIFLAFSYVLGLYIPSFSADEKSFATVQEIFNNAMKECQKQKEITKRKEKKRAFEDFEKRFQRFRNVAIHYRLNSMLYYDELKNTIKAQTEKNFNSIFNFKEIEKLLSIWEKTDTVNSSSIYSLSETFGFFKKEPAYKMNLIFNKHYEYIRKMPADYNAQIIYYFNRGFFSLYINDYSSAFNNYKAAIDVIKTQKIDNEVLTGIVDEIHDFFEFITYEENNYIFNIADFIVELACKGSEVKERYKKIINSEQYAQMPAIFRTQFEDFCQNAINVKILESCSN